MIRAVRQDNIRDLERSSSAQIVRIVTSITGRPHQRAVGDVAFFDAHADVEAIAERQLASICPSALGGSPASRTRPARRP